MLQGHAFYQNSSKNRQCHFIYVWYKHPRQSVVHIREVGYFVSPRLGDPFCSYSLEYEIKDVSLVAILNVGSHPTSIGHLPQPSPLCHWKMKSIGRSVLQLQSGIWNPRCQPGGHTDCWIMPEIDRAPPPTQPAMPQKYEINRATCSWVMVRNVGVRRTRTPSENIMPHLK
jgi:hypothetical protein